jgi:5,10-methylenetetrahydromethanopterin reductase
MKIGMLGLGDQYSIDTALAGAKSAATAGFDTYWVPGEIDPISAIVSCGREVPDIKLATSVIPVYSRHPVALAAEALLTNEAVGGRLILGIGMSHNGLVETKWGRAVDRPVRYLREYLSILVSLLDNRSVAFDGDLLSAHTTIAAVTAPRPPVLVAAMGPQTLRVAGRQADGTDTWMTGPRTLESLTVPTITAAAQEAQRPAPQIAAGMPVCITHRPDDIRALAAQEFGPHALFPTYQRMLELEDVAGPADIAIIGDDSAVYKELLRYRDIGVTDFIACPFGSPDDRARTRAALPSMSL